ncbi:MAG: hypothetical protein KTU85_11465 [Acidimicrobiia bacterium]|nr:hypothetical protein [Acidimicrobiia bacterium]MCY4458701.1 hypothetical protein [Acidimicrobiaceae bacterium]
MVGKSSTTKPRRTDNTHGTQAVHRQTRQAGNTHGAQAVQRQTHQAKTILTAQHPSHNSGRIMQAILTTQTLTQLQPHQSRLTWQVKHQTCHRTKPNTPHRFTPATTRNPTNRLLKNPG